MNKKEEKFIDVLSILNELQLEEVEKHKNDGCVDDIVEISRTQYIMDMYKKYNFIINTSSDFSLKLLNNQLIGISTESFIQFINKRIHSITNTINKTIEIDGHKVIIKELNIVIYRDFELKQNGEEQESYTFNTNHKCISVSVKLKMENGFKLVNAQKGVLKKSLQNSTFNRLYLNIKDFLTIPLSEYTSVRNLNKCDNLFIDLIKKAISKDTYLDENEQFFNSIIRELKNDALFKEYAINKLMFIPNSSWLSSKILNSSKNDELLKLNYKECIKDDAFNKFFNIIKKNSN